MQRVSRVRGLAALAATLFLTFLPACGGGNNNTSTVVTKILLTPSSISLNEGGVASLSAIAQNSVGNAIAADITFTSSNTNIATVSTGALVCGGRWDASFVNCNATIGSGGVGQVTITASTTNNVTATTTVYVHVQVDQVMAVLANSCTTMSDTVSVSGKAFSTSAPGCSPSAPCDITSTVGPFTFGTNDSSIVSINSSGGLVAQTPGATTIFASVSGVNGVGVPYLTCPVAAIMVHSSADSNTSFTLAPGGTQPLTADVYDTNNRYVKPTLTWGTSSSATATVAPTGSVNNPGTITAVAPGTAYITAACSYPNCNKFVAAQYSQNVVTATVSGSKGTTVYAASTNSTMLVPFDISTDVPGTAITLPFTPNSIIADPSGSGLYLGSASGLMAVTSSGTVTTLPVNGTIVAISADSKFMLLSDGVANQLNYFDLSTGTVTSTAPSTTVTSDAYTPDSGVNEWVTGTQFGFGPASGLAGTATLANAANALDIMAQGGLTYITSAAGQTIYVYSTCNQTENQALPPNSPSNSPTLVKAIPNGTGAVAVDSPNIDVISTPSTLASGCPVTTQSTINTYPLVGMGSFTATQMFVSPDSSAAWIVPNLPEVLYFSFSSPLTPTAVPLAGGAMPLNGGITTDSAHTYYGASDGTVHRIDTNTLSDVAQIAVNLKDSNGNVTPPNLLVVLP